MRTEVICNGFDFMNGFPEESVSKYRREPLNPSHFNRVVVIVFKILSDADFILSFRNTEFLMKERVNYLIMF